jgi:hypothetical protein
MVLIDTILNVAYVDCRWLLLAWAWQHVTHGLQYGAVMLMPMDQLRQCMRNGADRRAMFLAVKTFKPWMHGWAATGVMVWNTMLWQGGQWSWRVAMLGVPMWPVIAWLAMLTAQ